MLNLFNWWDLLWTDRVIESSTLCVVGWSCVCVCVSTLCTMIAALVAHLLLHSVETAHMIYSGAVALMGLRRLVSWQKLCWHLWWQRCNPLWYGSSVLVFLKLSCQQGWHGGRRGVSSDRWRAQTMSRGCDNNWYQRQKQCRICWSSLMLEFRLNTPTLLSDQINWH